MQLPLTALGLVALAGVACTFAAPVSTEPDEVSGPTTPAVAEAQEAPNQPTALVMWARGGLSPDVTTRASDASGVEAAIHLPSDSLGLVAVRDAAGSAILSLDASWRIPVDVTAVEPTDARAVLAAGDVRDAVAALQQGEALLTQSAADRHGVGAGAEVVLLGGHRLAVAGVVPDGTLSNGELLVHADDAAVLGMDPEGAVLVTPDASADETLARRLEALAPANTRVRVDTVADGETAPENPLVLSLTDVKERFGEFSFRDDNPDRDIHPDPAWVAENITIEDVPIIGRIRCHRAIFDDLRQALQAIRDAGLEGELDNGKYGGCYHPRRIGAGSESLSRHSWGIAIDLNVDFSVPGAGQEFHPGIIEAFANAGFRWGGLFLSPDNHHFEWVGDAAQVAPPPIGMGQTPS